MWRAEGCNREITSAHITGSLGFHACGRTQVGVLYSCFLGANQSKPSIRVKKKEMGEILSTTHIVRNVPLICKLSKMFGPVKVGCLELWRGRFFFL